MTRLYAQRNVGRALHEDVGQAILTLTGGEPRMVGHCVRRLGELDEADVPGDAARLQTMAGDLLADCELGHQLFTPLRREAEARLRVCVDLGKDDLGLFQGPHLDHPVLRRLFWRNALRVRQTGAKRVLAWRSDHLRRLGREILRCDA